LEASFLALSSSDCHLLGEYGQLSLHYWQLLFDTGLLGFVWGVVAGSE